MSRATDEINKVTGTVISLSWKLILIAVIILLLAEGAAQGYRFGYEVFSAEPMESAPGHDVNFTVTSDESDLQIMKDMKEAGLIRNSYATLVTEIFFSYNVYPGTYTLNTSMTPREMLEELNVKPEGYVEEAEEEAGEDTWSVPETAAAAQTAAEAEVYDEEPSEMVWEAVEAEDEPESTPLPEGGSGEEASEDTIEIHID